MSFSFGAATTTAASTFGTTTPSTGFSFGGGDAAKPLFGSNTGFSFGSGDTSKPLFGGSATGEKKAAFSFTSPTTSTPAFDGASSFAFGGAKTTAAAPTTSLFATPASTTAAPAFGAAKPVTFGGFASPPPNQTVGSPTFGQAAAQNAVQNQPFGASQQPAFGAQATQPATNLSFGSPANLSKPTSAFAFTTPASGFSAAQHVASSAPQTNQQSPFGLGGATSGLGLGQTKSFEATFGLGTTAAPSFGAASTPATAPQTFGAPTSSTGFSFNQPTVAQPATSVQPQPLNFTTQAPTYPGGLNFGAQPTQAPKTQSSLTPQTGLSFGATSSAQAPVSTGLSFGATSSAQAPASTGLSFAATSSAQTPVSTGLSFGATPGLTSTTQAPTSTGLSFGTTLAPSQPTAGLGFGTTPASTGLSFGTTQAATGLSFGTTPASTGPSFGTTSAAATTSLSFGTTAAAPQTTAGLSFGTTTAPATGLSFGTSVSAPQPTAGISFTPASTVASTAGLTFGSGTTAGLSFGKTTVTSAAAPAVSDTATFQLGQKPAMSTGFGLTSTASTQPSTAVSAPSGITALGKTTAATTLPSLTAAVTTAPVQPPQPITSITFAQLEENINKWTLELEEQEKTFINQATQINAWDRLLIANGEKIVEVNDTVQQVKNEQQSLELEIDFVLAQQKELDELLAPMEKQLLESGDRPRDPEREHMYSLAENLDSQLRSMSENLKEVVEHLNEMNRNQDSNDPIDQIGRILNVHMSSMQWIDSSIAQISTKLDQLKATHDTLRRDNERSFHMAYN